MLDHERIATPFAAVLRNTGAGSVRADRVGQGEVPEIITKKWICNRFQICAASGRACARMRRLVFTDDLLHLLQLSEEDWKRRRTFSRQETIIIIDFLRL